MRTPAHLVAADPQHGVGIPLKHEVMFKDGSSVWLHRVTNSDGPDLFTRAIAVEGSTAQVDLRRLAPGIEQDLPGASTRDMAGIVMYSLRQHFKSGAEFLLAARQVAA